MTCFWVYLDFFKIANFGAMAVYIEALPTLRGKAAERFEKLSEENTRRRATVCFSKEAANSNAILRKKSLKNMETNGI